MRRVVRFDSLRPWRKNKKKKKLASAAASEEIGANQQKTAKVIPILISVPASEFNTFHMVHMIEIVRQGKVDFPQVIVS